MGCSKLFGLDDQEFGKNLTRKQLTKKYGEEILDYLLQIDKINEDAFFLWSCSSKDDIMRKEWMTHSLNVKESPFPDNPVIPQ